MAQTSWRRRPGPPGPVVPGPAGMRPPVGRTAEVVPLRGTPTHLRPEAEAAPGGPPPRPSASPPPEPAPATHPATHPAGSRRARAAARLEVVGLPDDVA